MFKKLLFAFFLLVQSPVFSQGLFKGDKSELDIVTKLGKIPSITVLDKTGKKYQLEKYMEANKRHKDKPFLLVVWGTGEQTGVKSLKELAQNDLTDQYNIVSIFLDLELENADGMNEQIQEAGTEKTWDNFLLLSTNYDELKKGFYLDTYPMQIYTASNLDVITVSYVQPYTGAKAMLDNIQGGLKKGENFWHTDDGSFCNKDDDNAKFYNRYKVDGDNIFFTSNSKSKLLQKITYLKKGEEYLFNGELLTQTETGQKTGTGRFKEGVPVESYNTWYADGKKQFEFPVNGTAKGYDKTGKISFEGQIVNGLGNGTSTYYENEKKTSVYNYKAGVLSGIQKKIWGNGEVTEWFESPEYESGWYLYEGLQRVKKNDRWGFADRTGKIIIPIKYSFANDFSEGRANVELNDLYGYIDKTGKVVIPFQYTYADKFENGFANVTINGESFDIDKKGVRIKKEKEIEEKWKSVEGKYDRVYDFSEERAMVSIGKKYGYINKEGEEITAIIYEYGWEFLESLAKVKLNNKYGFIDKSGKVVIPIEYENTSVFEEGLAGFFENGKWGFIDKNNTKIIKAKYEQVNGFVDGISGVKYNGRYGLINKLGNEITISNKYTSMGYVEYGVTTIVVKDAAEKWGIIDKAGKEIVPLIYGNLKLYSENIIVVSLNGKWGIINKSNDVVLPLNYDNINNFKNNMASVSLNKKYGFINMDGKIAVPIKYENAALYFEEGLAGVKLNNKWGFVDVKGIVQIPIIYDLVRDFSYSGTAFVSLGDDIFIIDKKGNRQK